MALNQNSAGVIRLQATAFTSNGARTGFSLNSAYVHLTSGAGIGVRFVALEATPINEVLIFTDLTTGTRANINMRCRIYAAGTTAGTPAATLLATASTVTYPAADDQWIRAVFATPYTPAIGELVWIVWDNNAVAPATDFPNILTVTNTVTIGSNRQTCNTTANGFVASAAVTEMPFMVLQGTTWYGQPITQQTTVFTSNQLKRGMVITPTTNLPVTHIENTVSSASMTTVEIFESTQLPNATPIYTYNFTALERLIGLKTLPTPVTLFKGKTYYIVFDFSGNAATPLGGQIEDYTSFPAAFDQMKDGMGLCAGVQEIAGPAWSVFNNFFPQSFVYISNTPGTQFAIAN